MSTYTLSSTYTTADVGKVVDRFTSDYHMIAQSTDMRDREHVVAAAADVKLMAKRSYLEAASIVLTNSSGTVVRANKYTVSTDASGWTSDRPGDNLWPRQIGGNLAVIVSYSSDWWALTDQQQQSFKNGECVLSWTTSDVDTNFPGLPSTVDRRYSSNAYGMERRSYGSGT